MPIVLRWWTASALMPESGFVPTTGQRPATLQRVSAIHKEGKAAMHHLPLLTQIQTR